MQDSHEKIKALNEKFEPFISKSIDRATGGCNKFSKKMVADLSDRLNTQIKAIKEDVTTNFKSFVNV